MEHCKVHYINTAWKYALPTIQELDAALSYLKLSNAPMELGDLVLFKGSLGFYNDGIAIFDGSRIVPLEYNADDYGNLPKKFRVIEPTKGRNGETKIFQPLHWLDMPEDNLTGIQHNSIVWFNHRRYLSQCIHNIKYDYKHFDGVYGIYTHFVANNQIYYIVLFYHRLILLFPGKIVEMMERDGFRLRSTLNGFIESMACDDEENPDFRLPIALYSYLRNKFSQILTSRHLIPFEVAPDFALREPDNHFLYIDNIHRY
jgi:hypothetical protein